MAWGSAVGAGANGGAGRSGAREQFGPEHGTFGDAGSTAAPGAGVARASRLAEAVGVRTVTCSPHSALARLGEAHATATSSRAARQPRTGERKGEAINATNT